MSPRTAEYVAAMIREGDDFEYHRWLKSVRVEQSEARLHSEPVVDPQGAFGHGVHPIDTLNKRQTLPHARSLVMAKVSSPRRSKLQSMSKMRGRDAMAPLIRWLESAREAWDDFQASRKRDAVYEYLAAVFAIVAHYRIRRRTNRLLRHAFKFAHLPFDKHADPFSAVIRCTCGGVADSKTISKWARALRFVRRRKRTGMPLKAFMQEAGGVNACASRYAKHFERSGG